MMSVKEQIVSEIHKPARKRFTRRKVEVLGLNELLQGDLVERIPYANFNKGLRYILVVIDVFSKLVWVEPVKKKLVKDVTSAMKKILSRMSKIPKYFQTDNRKEFYIRDFKMLLESYNIHHFSSFSNLKVSVVERVNRT